MAQSSSESSREAAEHMLEVQFSRDFSPATKQSSPKRRQRGESLSRPQKQRKDAGWLLSGLFQICGLHTDLRNPCILVLKPPKPTGYFPAMIPLSFFL